MCGEGVCPVCGADVALDEGGKLCDHDRFDVTLGHTLARIGGSMAPAPRVHCEGSGCSPED
jgi:hypothetical protein